MTIVPKEEVLKISRLSRIALPEQEISIMAKQLQEVLTYAHRVCDMAVDIVMIPSQNVNVFREDLIILDKPKVIMSQVPESVQNYFVVPMVLEIKE